MFNYLSVEEVPRIAWVGWEGGGGVMGFQSSLSINPLQKSTASDKFHLCKMCEGFWCLIWFEEAPMNSVGLVLLVLHLRVR